jgi:hypothetical protein
MVPGSFELFVFDAEFGRLILFEQAEGDAAEGGEVFGAIVAAQAGEVFAEGDIKHPVGSIFNLPVSENGGVEKAAEAVALEMQ